MGGDSNKSRLATTGESRGSSLRKKAGRRQGVGYQTRLVGDNGQIRVDRISINKAGRRQGVVGKQQDWSATVGKSGGNQLSSSKAWWRQVEGVASIAGRQQRARQLGEGASLRQQRWAVAGRG